MMVLSQGKFKYNITGRNLSGLCDFLHMEGKFVENVSVVNGWKVWLFVEDTLICDYFVREKWDFWNLITVWNMTDNQYCRIMYSTVQISRELEVTHSSDIHSPVWRPRGGYPPQSRAAAENEF